MSPMWYSFLNNFVEAGRLGGAGKLYERDFLVPQRGTLH